MFLKGEHEMQKEKGHQSGENQGEQADISSERTDPFYPCQVNPFLRKTAKDL